MPASYYEGTQKGFTPLGHLYLTTTGTAAGVGALPVPAARVRKILIQFSTFACRWRDDAVAPTATVGFIGAAGTSLFYDGDVTALQFITKSGEGGGCEVQVALYGV